MTKLWQNQQFIKYQLGGERDKSTEITHIYPVGPFITDNANLTRWVRKPRCIFSTKELKYYLWGRIQSAKFDCRAYFIDKIIPSLSTHYSFLIYRIEYYIDFLSTIKILIRRTSIKLRRICSNFWLFLIRSINILIF